MQYFRTRRYVEHLRRDLWVNRESYLLHWGHQDCGVWAAVLDLAQLAEWTPESYLLAVVFDHEDLLTEVTK